MCWRGGGGVGGGCGGGLGCGGGVAVGGVRVVVVGCVWVMWRVRLWARVCGVAWCGVVRCGVVRCGVERFCAVWF